MKMASDLEQKIIRQIEYYFGDFNLPKDKFLKEKVGEDDGWVSVGVLLTFKRLASLTSDPDVIVDALEKSESGLLAISEDRKKIRRVPEKPVPVLTDDHRKEVMSRTAYAKGFPKDETQDNIMSFFEERGPIESCILRSYLDKATKKHVFKGSCFIVYKDVDACKKFIEAESVKYKDTELIRKFQSVYIEGKREEIQSRKDRRRKDKVQKEQAADADSIKHLPKGAILFFSGITNKSLTREEIKEKVCEIGGGEPSYIDFSKGDTEGYVRMPQENDAVEFHKKLTDGKMQIGDDALEIEVLEGEKEEEYLKKTQDVISRKRKTFNKGNRHNFKRKGANNDNNSSKSKKFKNK